jgi:ferrochelatase
MFNDPFILPFSKPVRWIIAQIISHTRYRKSWKKYQIIGGTPIIKATKKTVQRLQEKLGDNYKVTMAFSYSSPLLKNSHSFFIKENITDLTVIPLYPQASYTTTSSVKSEVEDVFSWKEEFHIRFIKDFYQNRLFILFWTDLISKHIAEYHYTNPFLLFSAHSIPRDVLMKGDTYQWAIAESSNSIARQLGLQYDFAYQSGMRKNQWIEPDIKDYLKELKRSGKREIIIIPISFVNENLETLYDLDRDIIPYAKNDLGIKSISRIIIPETNEIFINLLADLVTQ